MSKLDYDFAPRIGARATMGLIALSTDETIEPELGRIFPRDAVATYVSRIAFAEQVSPDTLREMEAGLPASAALLPLSAEFDVIGYGCTSGATMIGPARIAELISGTTGAAHVTDPITAVIAALRALNAGRIGFITPYVADVSAPMRAVLEQAGIDIAHFASFEEPDDPKVARISPAAIKSAILKVAATAPAEAIFVSCTNLRALDVIAEAEAEIGIPVISSNQALAWHMMRLAGLSERMPDCGALLRDA